MTFSEMKASLDMVTARLRKPAEPTEMSAAEWKAVERALGQAHRHATKVRKMMEDDERGAEEALAGPKREYRCTRPLSYRAGCPGHADRSARQGYYICATSFLDAASQMAEDHDDSFFDVQLWDGYEREARRVHVNADGTPLTEEALSREEASHVVHG